VEKLSPLIKKEVSCDLSKVQAGRMTAVDARQIILLTVNEAAETLRLSRATVYRLFRERKLRSVRIGYRRLIRVSELERIIKAGEQR
jgi:excisionase family DNA binding protein